MNHGQRISRLGLAAAWIVLALTPLANSQTSTHRPTAGGPQPTNQELEKELDKIEARFNDEKHAGILRGAGWTFAHFASETEAKKANEAIGFGSLRNTIKNAGGAEGYRKKVTPLLENKDVYVRGIAAYCLGLLGDRRATPDVVKLLRAKNLPTDKEFGEGFDRHFAALALGLLDAKDHAPDLVPLLKAEDEYTRAGAALGLGYMKATKHAPDVAKLLEDNRFVPRNAAVLGLVEMGAKDQAQALAAHLKSKPSDSVGGLLAMYALVKLKASDQIPTIASFLREPFYKGDAAKALALMNAQRYKPEIADQLKDDNPLARSGALMALGIMKATEYEEKIAGHLEDRDQSVRAHAAMSLILLESRKHASQALKWTHHDVLTEHRKAITHIVSEELQQVADRARASQRKLRAIEAEK